MARGISFPPLLAHPLFRFFWPLLALAVPLTLIAVLGSQGSVVVQRVITEAFIRMVMVIGLYIFIGNSGVLSFGHGAFMMLGAYASTWTVTPPNVKNIMMSNLPPFLKQAELSPAAGAGVAMLWAALVAFIVGIPLMQLTGIGAAIGTFSVLMIVYVVFSNWTSLTGGTSSMIGLPIYVDLWTAFGCALGAMTIAYLFQNTRLCLALRAAREDEAAARSVGVHVHRVRLAAFVLSAAVVALGGVLQVHFLGTANVAQFYLGVTFLTLAMLVVGGSRSLAGAVTGTVVIACVTELLRRVEFGVNIFGVTLKSPPGLLEVGLSIVLLLILVLRPRGITGGMEVPLPRASR